MSVTSDLRAFINFHKTVDQLFKGRKMITEITLYQMFKIKQRTAAGKDFNETIFRKYAEAYAAFRRSKGRTTEKVNLFFFGHMFAAMTYKIVDSTKSKIYFLSKKEEDKALKHNEGIGVPRRRFFAVSDTDAKKHVDIINNLITKALRAFR